MSSVTRKGFVLKVMGIAGNSAFCFLAGWSSQKWVSVLFLALGASIFVLFLKAASLVK